MIGCISHCKAHSKPHFMVNNVAWGAKSSKSQRSETDSARSGRIPGSQDPEVGKPSDHSWGCTWDDISWVSPWDCNSEKSWDMVPIYL